MYVLFVTIHPIIVSYVSRCHHWLAESPCLWLCLYRYLNRGTSLKTLDFLPARNFDRRRPIPLTEYLVDMEWIMIIRQS